MQTYNQNRRQHRKQKVKKANRKDPLCSWEGEGMGLCGHKVRMLVLFLQCTLLSRHFCEQKPLSEMH